MRVHFSNANQPRWSPHLKHLFCWAPHSRPPSTCPTHPRAGYQTTRDRQHLHPRALWSYSEEPILHLITLPHSFLPGETTLTVPPSLPPTDPVTVCPASWHLREASYHFNGNHLLIYWPHETSNFPLIHCILEQYHGQRTTMSRNPYPVPLASPLSGPAGPLSHQDIQFPHYWLISDGLRYRTIWSRLTLPLFSCRHSTSHPPALSSLDP